MYEWHIAVITWVEIMSSNYLTSYFTNYSKRHLYLTNYKLQLILQ